MLLFTHSAKVSIGDAAARTAFDINEVENTVELTVSSSRRSLSPSPPLSEHTPPPFPPAQHPLTTIYVTQHSAQYMWFLQVCCGPRFTIINHIRVYIEPKSCFFSRRQSSYCDTTKVFFKECQNLLTILSATVKICFKMVQKDILAKFQL